MIVQKVRGENRLKPIIMSKVEHDLAVKMGLKPEEFVKQYVLMIAKQRRWKWFFEKGKTNE
jgi:hypothetical protein